MEVKTIRAIKIKIREGKISRISSKTGIRRIEKSSIIAKISRGVSK